MDKHIDISLLNSILEPLDDQLTAGFETPELPIVFVVGQPRAGSTLLVQVLLNTFQIGYVSNVQAKLWAAPFMGALMEAELWDETFVSNFESQYGNTTGPLEPHEWGWFWQKWLRLEKSVDYIDPSRPVDWIGLAAKLAAMESVKRGPLLFDNTYAAANLNFLNARLPNLLAINLRRDPYFVCNSMINARSIRHGTIEGHYGNRPRNFDGIEQITDPVERVIAQVRATENEFQSILSKFSAGKVLYVDYEEMIAAPEKIANKFDHFLAQNGANIRRRAVAQNWKFENRNNPVLIKPEYRERLSSHFKSYFPENGNIRCRA